MGLKLGPVLLEKREVSNARERVGAFRRCHLVRRGEVDMTHYGGYRRLCGKDQFESFIGTLEETNLKILFLITKKTNDSALSLVGDDITNHIGFGYM